MIRGPRIVSLLQIHVPTVVSLFASPRVNDQRLSALRLQGYWAKSCRKTTALMRTLNSVPVDAAQPSFVSFEATTKATKSQTRPDVKLGTDNSPWAGHYFLWWLINPSLAYVPGHLARESPPLKLGFDRPHSLLIVMLHDATHKCFSKVIQGVPVGRQGSTSSKRQDKLTELPSRYTQGLPGPQLVGGRFCLQAPLCIAHGCGGGGVTFPASCPASRVPERPNSVVWQRKIKIPSLPCNEKSGRELRV